MSHLIEDCLRIVIFKLQDDPDSLYSCILVNRLWCRITVPILWKNPLAFNNISHDKFYVTIINMLSSSSKKLLFINKIVLPSPTTSRRPLFNYLSFLSQILPDLINGIIVMLIKDEIMDFQKRLLEREIYGLLINNCKNIIGFHWQTTLPLFEFSGSFTCFSNLNFLTIDLRFINSVSLSGMAQICQNIEDLNLWYCDGDISGLPKLIDAQRNLNSLFIYFKDVQKQCTQLSSAIKRKAAKLTKLIIKPSIASISPKFLSSLKNLKYLELNNDNDYEFYNEGKEMQEWKKCLSTVTFPDLQYLKIAYLPYYIDYKLIEKSYGSLLEIDICRRYEYQNSVYNCELIKAIAKYCQRIKKLTIDAEPDNSNEIGDMLLNCSKLETIDLSAKNDEQIICDKLLEIMINFSPKNLDKFSFNGYWIFSVGGLQSFFENWRNKFSIEFNIYLGDDSWITDEHEIIIEKYLNEGIIKKTNYFSL
ncbi:hypothetical protein RclHR1_08080005 [Rhizophagus clarus]|uniref:F-box domain-containing protein n=1 Tax=Rhizophagus clarus TaxID=94130 RepID=A0A2Z6S1M7_9GLOM|nr:hypothetical protein RclHR1_08080005 [Rhizophagus clarus]GES80952.1 hypothetical protein GLOIN_2v1511704 [Rhizophagus clarus]